MLIVPGELGYPTLDVLTRLLDRPGPVLADFGESRMGFFVPPGHGVPLARDRDPRDRRGGLDRGPRPGRHRGRGALADPAGRLGHAHRRGPPRLALHEAVAARGARGGG